MHLILTVLAIVCVLGGFVGFFFGVIPTLVLWVLAGLFIFAAWKSRPNYQRRREEHFSGPAA